MKTKRNVASTSKNRKPQSSTSSSKDIGQVRIIGGDWRGRKLPVLNAQGLRPTSDRVRETLFNWLQFSVSGARCLDLFAGSGALGFEALSRGAGFVQFIEYSPAVAKQLTANLQTLKVPAEKANLIQGDALQYIHRPVEKPFDVIFLDPPFHQEMLQTVIDGLFANQFVDEHTLIYIEQENTENWPKLPDKWQRFRDKKTSQVVYGLFRME